MKKLNEIQKLKLEKHLLQEEMNQIKAKAATAQLLVDLGMKKGESLKQEGQEWFIVPAPPAAPDSSK